MDQAFDGRSGGKELGEIGIIKRIVMRVCKRLELDTKSLFNTFHSHLLCSSRTYFLLSSLSSTVGTSVYIVI